MAVIGGAAGGGGAITNFPITFAKSCTWACPVVMEAYVFVIGGGGGGAAGSIPNATYRIQGGTAGGCAVSKLTLAVQNYTVVVGVGGVTASINDTYGAGNNGNDSSFDNDGGTAITQMVGVKGVGGGAATSGNNLAALTGGIATGGNLMNNTGGGVEALTVDQTVTAGGAVGLWEAGREGKGITDGLVENNFMGDDGLSYVTTGSEWGQPGPWHISPLNAASSTGGYSGYSNYVYNRQEVPAGMKSNYYGNKNNTSPSAYTAYAWFAGPFSGGVGNSSNHQYVSAGGGSLGGGGGGIISRHNGVGYVPKSAGGSGGVIIIPISLGS